MITRAALILSTLLFLSTSLSANASIGRNPTEFCNATSATIYLFLATKRGLGFFASSWRVSGNHMVPAGKCSRILNSDSLGMEVLVGAKQRGWFGGSRPLLLNWKTNDSGRGLGGSRISRQICVKDGNFSYDAKTIPSGSNCGADREPLTFFARFYIPADQAAGRFVNRIVFE